MVEYRVMHPNPSELFEWHIFESAGRSLPRPGSGIHMGPFSSEQECRTVLATVSRIPGFDHRSLEVRQQARRRDKRVRIKLPIRVHRVDTPRQDWAAHTLDISPRGARVSDPTHCLKFGEFVVIRYGEREAVFRVAWLGPQASSSVGQVGVQCLNSEGNLWDLECSEPGEGEPTLQEIATAQAVQRKLFPLEKPRLHTLDFCGKCIQAQTVGGDYYDFLDMGAGRVGFVMADVSGKGVAAALLMANLQGSIHNHPDIMIADLPAMLASLNLHLYKHTEPARYATLFFGCYKDHSRRLAYVNCGHVPGLLVRQDGRLERLEPTATVLGLFGSWECSVQELALEPGDMFCIFTDGISETMSSSGEEFGEVRVIEVLRASLALSPPEILENIEQALRKFRQSNQPQDDLTFLVARSV